MSARDDEPSSVIPLPLPPPTSRSQRATLKRPPLGRPPGALTVAEMTERISRDVGRAATSEIERRHGELRLELAADVRGATGLAIAAIAMNALAIVACLALSRVLPARLLAVGLAALTPVFASLVLGAARLGMRRRAAALSR
ncbi:MAG TPA: hypothetical protein VHL80_03225 [Polyangia bacterium]|nr:hypothetical protein [Polyangia bacterium]